MSRSSTPKRTGGWVVLAALLSAIPLHTLAYQGPSNPNADLQPRRPAQVPEGGAFGAGELAIQFDRPSLPAKRSYDTHHYYAVELHSRHSEGVDPREVAEVLGAELVERVGELKDHWLVRSEKPLEMELDARDLVSGRDRAARRDLPHDQDPILRRWADLRSGSASSHSAHGLAKRYHAAAKAIRGVERQELRVRAKRNVIYSPWDTPHLYPEVRDPIPGPEPLPYPDPAPRPPVIPDPKTAEMAGLFDIRDPIFPDQWHLANDRIPGYDLNLTGVWNQGIKGKGVNVCLIDDGLDMHSPDLKENFFEEGSYDFNAHTALPEPRASDDQHGTRCAGEIAALRNDVCGVGVAYEAHVSGVRILSGPISDVDEAAALNYRYQENHVYSCSWGPPDDGRSMDAPKGLIAKAMLNGVQNGRDGKGSIFVFAGGNGGSSDDQCNFDGYTNSIYSMTIAAVDREGTHPYYSEMCSANLAASWSSGSGDHIHTTDVAWNGVNKCTTRHGGTSAAAPLVAGVAALALQVRPDLTWRDMQHVAIRSAQMVNPGDKDWQRTQAGRNYNHKYGYGVIDAYQFVEEAKAHKLVKPQAWFESPNVTQPVGSQFITEEGLTSTYTITKEMLENANLATLEHVTVRVWIDHERRGDVEVELTSPHGTKSVLARPRRYDDAKTGFPGWSFMTLKHWDEDPLGEWTLRVIDRPHPEATGNFHGWAMTLWGESIDPSKAKVWSFPADSVEAHETLAAAPSTTTLVGVPTATQSTQHSKPTNHLPDDHGSAPGESHEGFTDPNNKGGGNNSTAPNPEADTGYISGLKNSTLLFVAGGVVLIFAGSVAAFFWMRRGGRGRGGGGSGSGGGNGGYEFVPEDEEVAMSALERGRIKLGGGAGGAAGGGGRRTKELYDAFGEGGSEDEEDEENNALTGSGSGSSGRRGGLTRYVDEEDEDDDAEEGRQFVIEDEHEPYTPGTATKASGSGAYRDEPDEDQPEREEREREREMGKDREETASGSSGGSGSGGSWQDAGAEVKEP